VDSHFITSQGPGTALEFSLAVVEVLFGPERKKQVAEPMLAE
jgi:4-methyl-5(b-hydroxyethyl)-thiazole monophosphate biosynthesis